MAIFTKRSDGQYNNQSFPNNHKKFGGKESFNERPLPEQNLLENKSTNVSRNNSFCLIRQGSFLDKKFG